MKKIIFQNGNILIKNKNLKLDSSASVHGLKQHERFSNTSIYHEERRTCNKQSISTTATTATKTMIERMTKTELTEK